MDYNFIHLNKKHSVSVEKSGDKYSLTIEKATDDVTDFTEQNNVISFRLNDRLCTIYFAQEKNKIHLATDGEFYIFEMIKGTASKAHGSTVQEADSVSSPMPGLLVKVSVAVGDKVSSGATLAIVEAMKMQNELRAPRDGMVKKINFEEGAQIDALKPIVELESE
jgi:biotin carboxyl carrier protein